MKVFGIVVFMLILSISTNVFMDLLLGFSFSNVMSHLVKPFWTMKAGEYLMLTFLLLLIIGQQIFFILKNKENKQNGSS
jgi:hypothetical protein